MRKTLRFLILSLAASAASVPATAQGCPPLTLTHVSPGIAAPGDVIDLEGDGHCLGDEVVVAWVYDGTRGALIDITGPPPPAPPLPPILAATGVLGSVGVDFAGPVTWATGTHEILPPTVLPTSAGPAFSMSGERYRLERRAEGSWLHALPSLPFDSVAGSTFASGVLSLSLPPLPPALLAPPAGLAPPSLVQRLPAANFESPADRGLKAVNTTQEEIRVVVNVKISGGPTCPPDDNDNDGGSGSHPDLVGTIELECTEPPFDCWPGLPAALADALAIYADGTVSASASNSQVTVEGLGCELEAGILTARFYAQ